MSNTLKPIVSVILPNYNHGRYLKKRVHSILNQTFQDFELIILDDASTDNSIDIIEEYKQNTKVSCIDVNTVNSGSTFKQWSKGIQLAKGRFIWIAESDDFASDDFLNLAVRAMESESSVDLVYCDSYIVDEKNEILGLSSTNKNDFFKTNKWSNHYLAEGRKELIGFLLTRTTINNASAVLFRKDCLSRQKYLDNLVKFKNLGDLYTYSTVLLTGNILYLNYPLNSMREHPMNTTKLNHKNGLIYYERVLFYLDIIDEIFLTPATTEEILKLRESALSIIYRNFSHLLTFGYYDNLKSLLNKFRYYKLIGWKRRKVLLLLFKLYNFRILKLNSFSGRAIKYLCIAN